MALEVTVVGPPASPEMPTGVATVCQDGENTSYTTTGSVTATSYMWMISPAEAGTITGDAMEGEVDWDADFSGMAMITVKGVSDCGEGEESMAMEVTVNALPDVSLDNYPTVYEDTAPFELTGGSPAGGTYSGPGVVDGMFYPADAEMGTHTITYTVEENGCENYAEATIVVEEASAINEYVNGLSLQIFPNPNNGEFMIQLNALQTSKINLKVMNNLGVEVYSENDIDVTNTLDKNLNLSHLAKGVYFINIYNEETSILKKMIIRK
jgi:hypothetical protein